MTCGALRRKRNPPETADGKTIPVPKKLITYQGEPGANSDLACRKAYPDYTPLPCATFEDAFAAVRSGRAALGMIPIENSVAGRVADIHHLMPHSKLQYRRRIFPARASSVDGAEGREPEDAEVRREPHPCARPVPQSHPRAWPQGGGGG